MEEQSRSDEKIYVARAMERYGGNFAKKLGMVIFSADPINVNKIKNTWPELWEEYLAMGKRMEE